MLPEDKNPRNPFELLDRQMEWISKNNPLQQLNLTQFQFDLVDTGEELMVTVDIPGFGPEDIELTIENDEKTLNISGERETMHDENEENIIWQGHRSQSIQKTIPLPVKVKRDEATANFKNGVVTIVLPKQETEETNNSVTIEINNT